MASQPSPLARGPVWQLDDVHIQRLAQELARDMYPVPEVLGRYNLDAAVFVQYVRPNPVFTKAYLEARTMWHSTAGTEERIEHKARATFEDWLAEADTLFHDRSQPLSAKVEMMKMVGNVGGLMSKDKDQKGVAPGERVVINIDLSGAGRAAPIVIDQIAPPVIDLGAAE